MGIHFDGLVNIIKKCLDEDRQIPVGYSLSGTGFNMRNYLQNLVFDASLFQFPLNPKDIFGIAKKNLSEYVAYVTDYMDISAKYGKFVIMPFDLTAIEDTESVVFLDSMKGNRFNTVVFRNLPKDEARVQEVSAMLYMGIIEIGRPKANLEFPTQVKPTALFNVIGDRLIPIPYEHDPQLTHDLGTDISQAAVSYIDELVYIMDPGNFIIHKESNASVADRSRKGYAKRRDILRTTIRRPHYVCLNQNETADYLADVSLTPKSLKPVAGHWKTLISEKFVRMRGQKIFVAQYSRGNPDVKGSDGWNYRVMIKEAPDKLEFYSDSKK